MRNFIFTAKFRINMDGDGIHILLSVYWRPVGVMTSLLIYNCKIYEHKGLCLDPLLLLLEISLVQYTIYAQEAWRDMNSISLWVILQHSLDYRLSNGRTNEFKWIWKEAIIPELLSRAFSWTD
jgi:hypothetical protein